MEDKPLVSIALATYNGEETIYKTLKSIQNQTYTNFECIIVDDHSSDNTTNIIYNCFCKNDKRFKLLVNTTSEQYVDAHNQSYEMCNGKYLFRIDQDDIYFNDYLEFNVNYMDNHPEYDAICTRPTFKKLDDKNLLFTNFNDNSIELALSEREYGVFNQCPATSMLGNTFIFSNMTSCIRSSFFNKHHPKFTFFALGDYIFWFNVLANGGKLHSIDIIKTYKCYNTKNSSLLSNFNILAPRAEFALNTYKWQALQIAKDRDNFLVDDLINEYKKKADDAFKQMVEQDDPDNRKRQEHT